MANPQLTLDFESIELEKIEEPISSPVVEVEQKVFSVSDLNIAIREQLENKFALVWLKGEISNFKPHGSGHYYFSLKDEKAQINAVMFKGFNAHLKFRPENGLEVMIRGKVTVYPPRGQYQIFCEVMEPVGRGALQLQFEQLKSKLQSEGLFEQSRKKTLPAFPQKVAIVTSPTGAAIRDMINVLGRRYRGLEITIIACAVQGKEAPKEIIKAIELANKLKQFDVMIIGRGGGSMEDLWAFNDEHVARAIAASKIPTVSGVGHEVDFTIADFVADLRAPTPSAAAELIVKNAMDLQDKFINYQNYFRNFIINKLASENQKITSLRKQLVDPKRKLQEFSQKCDELLVRLENAIENKLELERNKIQNLMALLDSLSPLKVMNRGYAIVKNQKDKVIKSIKGLKNGDAIFVQLHQGKLEAKINKIGVE